MIHSVLCKFNNKVVREVNFEPGVNLIVAERSPDSSDKDSRNGLGKTTLLRIIDFCLGSDVNKKGTLQTKYLPGWEFAIELDIRGRRVTATRAIDDDKTIRVEADTTGWPVRCADFQNRNSNTDHLPAQSGANPLPTAESCLCNAPG